MSVEAVRKLSHKFRKEMDTPGRRARRKVRKALSGVQVTWRRNVM
jgi:hypothetical protein